MGFKIPYITNVFFDIFSPNPQITIILLVKVPFQEEIMNIILVCNLQKSSLVLYLDFAATCQKLNEVHLYPTSLPYLGEFSVSSPYYLGQRLSKVSYSLLYTENQIKLGVLFELDLDGTSQLSTCFQQMYFQMAHIIS